MKMIWMYSSAGENRDMVSCADSIRRKEDVVLDISTPFACRNVETGETGVHLPAESCGMFIF